MYIVKKNKNDKWIVIEEGKKRANKTFTSKIEAVAYAKKISSENNKAFKVIEDKKLHKGSLFLIIIILLIFVFLGVLYLTDNETPKYLISFEGTDQTINVCEIPENLPVLEDKDDYKFVGWYLDEDCTNPAISGTKITESIKLYPKWELKQTTVIEEGELSIHFLELGNQYAGDSVYIKAGDIDILIDAGSKKSSSTTIHNYIKEFCTDSKLEYVIATHAHEDHISGFVGSSNNGIFDLYECETIIDYSLKNTTSKVSSSYEEKRDIEVSLGAKHYTARECIEEINGAKKKYQLTNDIYFEILDQEYYYKKTSDENDYSVCLLLTYGENNFLFTGDLEENGEKSLVEKNDLPHCKLFKGGHHGSKTSSNEILLKEITPEIVCVCCCAGSNEYTSNVDNMFPTQAFINRIAKYTDKIYVTTLAKYKVGKVKETDNEETLICVGYESMNGNIVVSLNEKNELIVNCSNNNTILKDTDWFNSTITLNGITRKMRIWNN